MKIRLIYHILIWTVIGFFSSCTPSDNCDDIDCTSPANPLYLNVIDSSSHINLFASQVYDSNSFYVVNMENISQKANYIQQTHFIELPEIPFFVGKNYYQLVLEGDLVIVFSIDMSNLTENCCNFYRMNSFEAVNILYEFDKNTQVATLLISR
jgi:hypothetical protein